MLSTTDIVKKYIKEQPLLEESLAKGIINYSALARDLQPYIEKKLMKEITRGAIVMALKRISISLKQKKQIIQSIINLNNLTVRSDLVEFTYLNSDTIVEKHKKVFSAAEKKKDVFCSLSQGVRETMFVVGKEIANDIENIFGDERLIAKIENLSSITIVLSKEVIDIPGVYYSILKLFAWDNMKLIDVISTYSELTIIFTNKDVDRAFSILKNYKQ